MKASVGVAAVAVVAPALSWVMRSRPALFVLSALAVVALSGAARADCLPVPLAREIQESDLVFVGTVTRVSGGAATFSVSDVYKGTTGQYVSVTLDPRGLTIGADAVGTRYVVLLRMTRVGLRVSRCGNTQSGPGIEAVVQELRRAGYRTRPPERPQPPG